MLRLVVVGVGILALVVLMPVVFFSDIDPNEMYQLSVASLDFDEKFAGAVVGASILLTVAWSLTILKGKVSFWPAAALFAILIVPCIVISPLMLADSQWNILEVNLVLAGCFILFVVVAGWSEAKLSAAGSRWASGDVARPLDEWEFGRDRALVDLALLAALVVSIGVIVTTLGLNVDLRAGLEDVYSERLRLRDLNLGFVGYLIGWVIVLGAPIVYAIMGPAPSRLALSLTISLMIGAVILISSSQKGGVWSAALPLLFFTLRRLDVTTRIAWIVVGLVALTVVSPAIGSLNENLEVAFLDVPRRVFYVPGYLHGLGVSIFSDLPPMGFEDLISRFSGEVVLVRYTYVLGLLTGVGEETNANVSFFLDGYINARYAGMLGVTVVAALTVGMLAALARLSGSTIGVLYLIILAQQYAEAAFQQVYLTSGVVVVAGFLLLRLVLVRPASRPEPSVAPQT